MTGVTFSPKPEGSTWTDDQWRAVSAEGSNILVAAAAGSGKTAVLVERIIRKISTDADVDRLLVATFTKAAASEMKERVRIALEGALERNPESEHLRRQLALINRSSITTLHSFCLDVIRSYYPLIGLDPGFRMAGETESELLRIDALDELFERKYAGEDVDSGSFLMLADRYGGERGDEPLYRLVQKLYDFSRSHPWPDHWLRSMAAKFRLPADAPVSGTEWVDAAKADVRLSLLGAAGLLEQALELTRRPAGPAPYAETFTDDLTLVSGLIGFIAAEPWEAWSDKFEAVSFGRLKAMKGDEYDPQLKERAKDLRDKAKGIVGGLADKWFRRSTEQYRAELDELAPLMEALSELVIAFGGRYEELKRDKGLLDFSDLEHGCLRILRDAASTPDAEIPSSAALEYRDRFVEILLDEYQDTNTVQEAIVTLIARPNNRFMVGDVKQSIYRFRLAEPNLFLHKYKTYLPADYAAAGLAAGITAATGARTGSPTEETGETIETGVRIDLARNFRSRSEVVDGVNGIFRAVMRESVGELEYDERAELVCGADYPSPDKLGRCAAELVLIDKNGMPNAAADQQDEESDTEAEEGVRMPDASDLQTAQLEARAIARRILELREEGHPVWDGRRKAYRPLEMRDIVILLRATQQWAPIMIEELQTYGIPAYAELGTGYFDATEVEVMMSLLRVIDNPYQDIPLAGALRSPIFGLTGEELAHVRIGAGRGSFYDAVRKAVEQDRVEQAIRHKLELFLIRLDSWREAARQGSLTELLASLYRETGYYDFVGGLPGGPQRQANLRALLDRARQYEATSFRGLFRFLRFIERMRDTGGDLGTARALGEQEDVVRIMSIHKSKGLEFPVVFIAGLGKMFNMQDLNAPFLLHKELGYGPKFIDAELRVSYPTLPYLAIGNRLRMEMLAEEMRILYVAVTRPKEKMILIGTVSDAVSKLEEWSGAVNDAGRLPDDRLASARAYLDWLGPLAAGSGMLTSVQQPEYDQQAMDAVSNESDMHAPVIPLEGWRFGVLPAVMFAEEAAPAAEQDESADQKMLQRLAAALELAVMEPSEAAGEVGRLLSWTYAYESASLIPAKTSVTEMKRLHAEAAVAEDSAQLPASADPVSEPNAGSQQSAYTYRLRRPRFMEEKTLTAAERGTVSHLLMQHIPLAGPVTAGTVQETVDSLISRQIMTVKQAEAIQAETVHAFFESGIGQRLLQAYWVRRELPFSCAFPASRIYGTQADGAQDEPILIQGVVDCLFRDEAGIVLLDYKTDQVRSGQYEQAAERHRFQLDVYAEALEQSLGEPVRECYVHFLSGGVTVKLR